MKAEVARSLSELSASGRVVATIDAEILTAMGATENDLIEIRTQRGRKIWARVGAPRSTDAGTGLIRMDRFLRQACKVRLGEEVELLPVTDQAVAVKTLYLNPAVDVSSAHHLIPHLRQTFSQSQTPVSLGSVLYATFHHSTAGTTYKVVELDPGPGIITAETEIVVEPPDVRQMEGAFEVTFEDVGGLEREIQTLRELVELPLHYPHVYRHLGIMSTRGIILYGPPGTGKTHIARALANEVGARFYYINGPEIVGVQYGESEANLRRIFNEAAHHSPSLVVIDELDALAPRRGESGAFADIRLVSQFLSLMDGLQKVDAVVVVGTTNRVDAIDPAFRRPGRFDREIFIAPPSPEARLQILQIHTREMPLTDGAIDFLPEVARATHGFVGADLMELCRESGLSALRHSSSGLRDHLSEFRFKPEQIWVDRSDFEVALQRVRPSAIREALVTVPDVTWADVGGLESVKTTLQHLIEGPLLHPESFRQMGLNRPSGILLYGPPGTGKTLLAKAVANESGVNFLAMDGPEVFSKWVGESEEAIRHIFRVARQLSPSIIFFDQLDAIAPARGDTGGTHTTERVVSQLLAEMDGLDPLSNVVVMGATNRMDLLDPSVLRPGRFSVHLHVPLPTFEARAEILSIQLRGIPLAGDTVAARLVSELAAETDGFSGAELQSLCDDAKLLALRRGAFRPDSRVSRNDLIQALDEKRNSREQWLADPGPVEMPSSR